MKLPHPARDHHHPGKLAKLNGLPKKYIDKLFHVPLAHMMTLSHLCGKTFRELQKKNQERSQATTERDFDIHKKIDKIRFNTKEFLKSMNKQTHKNIKIYTENNDLKLTTIKHSHIKKSQKQTESDNAVRNISDHPICFDEQSVEYEIGQTKEEVPNKVILNLSIGKFPSHQKLWRNEVSPTFLIYLIFRKEMQVSRKHAFYNSLFFIMLSLIFQMFYG